MSNILDLGDDHTLCFVSWAPDRNIEANRVRYEGMPDIERVGAIVSHKKPDGSDCEGVIMFRLLNVDKVFPGPSWEILNWEPLTLSPSLLCSCGDHGFIRDGKWSRA